MCSAAQSCPTPNSLQACGLQPVHQAPLSMEFLRQEYCHGLPFPASGDLLDPGIELMSLVSPALAGGFITTMPPGKPPSVRIRNNNSIHLMGLIR